MKFLSRKWLSMLIGIAADILISRSVIPAEVKPLLIQLVTSLSGVYTIVEGIIDAIKKEKK